MAGAAVKLGQAGRGRDNPCVRYLLGAGSLGNRCEGAVNGGGVRAAVAAGMNSPATLSGRLRVKINQRHR